MARWWRHAPPLVVYRDPGEDPISFGDVFECDYLIDIHCRANTRALGGGDMQRTTAEKLARAESRSLEPGDPVPVYSPLLPPRRESSYVLGSGTTMKLKAPVRAILISDSCAVDTALGVDREGRRPDGRLLFAPLVPATALQLQKLTDPPIFGRFPLIRLAESDDHDGAVAELRCCFMVDARDVDKKDRILALTAEAAEDLEVAWDAYALRRGPQAVEHNVGKLARRLGRDPDSRAIEDAMDALERALESAWRLEGGALRRAAATREGADLATPEEVARLMAELQDLERLAREARERLALASDERASGGQPLS